MIKELGEELVPVDVAGVPAWMTGAEVGDVIGARPSDVVRLVPAAGRLRRGESGAHMGLSTVTGRGSGPGGRGLDP